LENNIASEKTLMGHPVGLFILFFTEMWERFSYYGMKALLVLFLITKLSAGGWEWSRESAMQLMGWYSGLVYLTPLLGGFLADKFTGYKKAILIGALIMTIGHLCMALEFFHDNFFYLGLVLMILGNGMFKPNISTMVGQLYPDNSDKKDSGYTIFYMGINAGAFIGMLLCGYIGEKINWHYGFGLAGIFMLFGMLQFYFGQGIFGKMGDKITQEELREEIIEDEITPEVRKDRLFVIVVLMIFSIFFFWAFEQSSGSMTIFAKDYTQRALTGDSALIFKWVDAALTIFPMAIVTWVLFLLSKKIYKDYPLTIIFTAISFVIIWILGIWKVYREFFSIETEVQASWFLILNSFFIIALASSFTKFFEKVYNPTGPIKFSIGLILVGVGFGCLAYGSLQIPQGAATASVSMIWLILAYFFHTLGELCLSPVGLSYVSKLSPKNLLGLIFGFWFLASAIAGWLAGWSGSLIDQIMSEYSLSFFFMIFTILPILFGILLIMMNKMLVKKMHGIH
jgi:POT family proton-dependent oligopeptide transporter